MKMLRPAFLVLAILILAPAVHAASCDVVIVRGDLPADLIVAQVYTQKADIPLIPIRGSGLNQELVIELQGYGEQGYKKALIIGGDDIVPGSVESTLEGMGYSVERIWDWDRYGTSARAAIQLWGESDNVVVTPGDQKGGLTSAARIAIDYECPLLFTRTGSLPEQVKQAIETLGARRTILIGNVSDEVRNELSGLGGLEQTKLSYIELEEKTSNTGVFVVGILVGAIVIFLVSTLWGAGFLSRKEHVPYSVLNEDEQMIVDIVTEHGGVLKQKQLPKLTEFSRPKVSRIVSDLLERGILSKRKMGKTYVVKLEKKVRK